MTVKEYIKTLERRFNGLCCAWEIALELENETDIPLYIEGLRSHQEDCECLSIIADELEKYVL